MAHNLIYNGTALGEIQGAWLDGVEYDGLFIDGVKVYGDVKLQEIESGTLPNTGKAVYISETVLIESMGSTTSGSNTYAQLNKYKRTDSASTWVYDSTKNFKLTNIVEGGSTPSEGTVSLDGMKIAFCHGLQTHFFKLTYPIFAAGAPIVESQWNTTVTSSINEQKAVYPADDNGDEWLIKARYDFVDQYTWKAVKTVDNQKWNGSVSQAYPLAYRAGHMFKVNGTTMEIAKVDTATKRFETLQGIKPTVMAGRVIAHPDGVAVVDATTYKVYELL